MRKKEHYGDSEGDDDDLFIDQTTPILEEAEQVTGEEENKVRRSREIKRKTDILEDLHLVAAKGPQVHYSQS